MNFAGKRVLVTGGTGSLGQTIVRRLLNGELGLPERVTVFSRDEARQHAMRLNLMRRHAATDEVIFGSAMRCLAFCIGDIRDPVSVRAAITDTDIVINAAAMKQVPTCEYFPEEAHRTNVCGAINIMNAVRELARPPEIVVGISTDKAVKPVNVMGLTKALQERVLIRANLACPGTRFIVVRYGNVISSRGSAVPLFRDQLRRNDPVTITDRRMTRFMMSLDDAVDTIAFAIEQSAPGEITIPRAPAARMLDVAQALHGDAEVAFTVIGIRPGEKLHEILISEEEVPRTIDRDGYYLVRPMIPELAGAGTPPPIVSEYSSADHVVGLDELRRVLGPHGKFSHAVDAEAGSACM